MTGPGPTEMRVVQLSTCRRTGQPSVVLEDTARTHWLAFYLPANEANRLSRCLGSGPCTCAPIYDLVEQLVKGLDARVARVELDCDEAGVSACLVLDRDGTTASLGCHPADAMALAIRAGAPIVATPAAMARARPVAELLRDERSRGAGADPDGLARWLASVSPSDF
jgi:bifunctional DNase/RNase